MFLYSPMYIFALAHFLNMYFPEVNEIIHTL